MKILGIHAGHDASVALIVDGHVQFLAHIERISRQKKHYGLNADHLHTVLDRAGLSAAEIDYCTVTSTQGIDIVFDRTSDLRFCLERHKNDTFVSDVESVWKSSGTSWEQFLDPTYTDEPHLRRRKNKRNATAINNLNLGARLENVSIMPCLNRYIVARDSSVFRSVPLKDLAKNYQVSKGGLSAHRRCFHAPATVTVDGHSIPASIINHHAAHAAATFYQSPFENAAILTVDGGVGEHEGGLLWFGNDNEIFPLSFPGLMIGQMYLNVAHRILKLGSSAEGKMMGLAPYGKPVFYEERFVANIFERIGDKSIFDAWVAHLKSSLIERGDEIKAVGDPRFVTDPMNADVAASAQLLFEETVIQTLRVLTSILEPLSLGTDNITLSGGCMLNCHTNTRAGQDTKFSNVFVEPSCDDGGLAAGSALWMYHTVMENSRRTRDPQDAGLPFIGLPIQNTEIETALSGLSKDYAVSLPDDIATTAAERLAEGKVVGWFEGRSEVGPRALGHRSVLADPRHAEVWERVNQIKGRELWRPLAPSVLADEAENWFDGPSLPSPFMLFTADVRSHSIPAITHVDNTARVQTVDYHCGKYYNLLRAFNDLTGCPVLLNTSMNGPGEPIVECPDEAIELLKKGRFDILVLEDKLIEPK